MHINEIIQDENNQLIYEIIEDIEKQRTMRLSSILSSKDEEYIELTKNELLALIKSKLQ